MAHAVKVIYTIKDDKGKLSTSEIKIPTGISVADMVEFAQEMGTLINNVTTGQIVNVGIAVTVEISGLGWATSPGSTSDVEERGSFQFETAGQFRTGAMIPCWSDLLVIDGTDQIDQTDTDVIAFRDAMLTGILLPVGAITVSPCDVREDDIASLVYARERFRSSGKRP